MVGSHRVLPRKRRVLALIRNLILRPKVWLEVGDPIDVATLAGLEPGTTTTDLPSDQVRKVADEVWDGLITVVAQVRGEDRPS